MPIRFPLVTMGPVSKYREAWLMNFGWKAFNAPAPNLARPGAPFLGLGSADGTQVILNPGLGISPNKAVNVRRLGTMYQAPDQTARVNPAAPLLVDHVDDYNADNRVLGSQNLKFTGITYDATGALLGGCQVMVFRTGHPHQLVGETTSDGSGNWTLLSGIFPGNRTATTGVSDQEGFYGGPFFVVAYKEGTPVFGTGPNTVIPVPV